MAAPVNTSCCTGALGPTSNAGFGRRPSVGAKVAGGGALAHPSTRNAAA